MSPEQTISEELQELRANIKNTEGYVADAYAALQSNGATLPEKCNAENLAGCIEENKWQGGTFGMSFGYSNQPDSGILSVKTQQNDTSPVTEFCRMCSSYSNRNEIQVPLGAYASNSWAMIVTVLKSRITACHLDFEQNSPTYNFLLGGVDSAGRFDNLARVEIANVKKITNHFCAYSFTGEQDELILGEGLEEIDDTFLLSSLYNGDLVLPSSLKTISTSFCSNANNLKSVFIPENAIAPTDIYCLSTQTATASSYVNGIILKGPGAKAWKAALPDRTLAPYRKLILDSEWA